MELISYSLDFTSFFIQNTKNVDSIKSILLFGSSARGEADKNSDIDIFIDVLDKEKEIVKETRKIVTSFFESVKFKKYWKLLGINNNVNVIVGRLEQWKLKDAMLGSAIVLYAKYSPKIENGKNSVILFWANVKPNSKRVMLNKKISGYKHYKRVYLGALEKYEGRKLGSNVILISIDYLNEFLKIFRHFGVSVKIIRTFQYD